MQLDYAELKTIENTFIATLEDGFLMKTYTVVNIDEKKIQNFYQGRRNPRHLAAKFELPWSSSP